MPKLSPADLVAFAQRRTADKAARADFLRLSECHLLGGQFFPDSTMSPFEIGFIAGLYAIEMRNPFNTTEDRRLFKLGRATGKHLIRKKP